MNKWGARTLLFLIAIGLALIFGLIIPGAGVAILYLLLATALFYYGFRFIGWLINESFNQHPR